MAGLYSSVLLFGAPGVGKGTQGELLGRISGFVHMASGDIFRALEKDSELGRKFHEYSSQGLLVPDEVTIEVWRDHVRRCVEDGTYRPDAELLVLDGIPRSTNQCSELDAYIDVLSIVHLKAPDIDVMVDRLKKRATKQGRTDDADESVIRRRFEVYDKETSPVLGYYPAKLLHEVDAVGLPAEVHMHVLETIMPIYARRFGNPL
jgi:adenylate kinase